MLMSGENFGDVCPWLATGLAVHDRTDREIGGGRQTGKLTLGRSWVGSRAVCQIGPISPSEMDQMLQRL